MPPKKRTSRRAGTAPRAPGAITKTTTRYFPPTEVSSKYQTERMKVEALRREVRSLKDVLIGLMRQPTGPSTGTTLPPLVSTNKQLQRIARDKLQSDISDVETRMTLLYSQIQNLGDNIKQRLDYLSLDRSKKPAEREQTKRSLVTQARMKKRKLTSSFNVLKRRLEALRTQLSQLSI